MPINTKLRWLTVCLILAAVVHLVVVYATPVVLTTATLNRLLENAPANTMMHHPVSDTVFANQDLSNPAMLVSTCIFDVTQTPLRIEALVPPAFWSLALYTRDRKAFFVLNESQTPIDNVTIDLVGPSSERTYLRDDILVPIIEAPQDQGIAVVRILVSDETKRDVIEDMRTSTRCTLIEKMRPIVVPRLKPR